MIAVVGEQVVRRTQESFRDLIWQAVSVSANKTACDKTHLFYSGINFAL